jgi:hypothetical protein
MEIDTAEGKKSGYETVRNCGEERRAEVGGEERSCRVDESGGVRQTFRWSLAGIFPREASSIGIVRANLYYGNSFTDYKHRPPIFATGTNLIAKLASS